MNDRAAASGRWSRPVLAVPLIVTLWAVIYLPGLKSLPLADPEESRCAAIVQAMLRSGDWLVPQLDGRPYFEKPPLFFWLASAATALTGQMELGGRIVSALSALGVSLCVWVLGRRMFSAGAGFWGALASVLCVEHIGLGRWYRMEMLFVLLLVLTLACFWLALVGQASRLSPKKNQQPTQAGRLCYLFFCFFSALAVLAKGPLGLLLPLLIAVVYLAAAGQYRLLRRFPRPGGVLLFVLVACPWYAYMVLRFGWAYVDDFIIGSHFDRALTGFAGNTLPGGFYLLVLAVGLVPWTILLPAAARQSFPWPRLKAGDGQSVTRVISIRPAELFLWTWAIVIVVFFELSRTKFIHYILPALAPLALIVGQYLDSVIARGGPGVSDRDFGRTQWAAMVGAVIVAAGLPTAELLTGRTDLWALVMLPAGLATLIGMRYAMGRARPGLFAAVLIAGMAFAAAFAIGHTMPPIYDKISYRSAALANRDLLREPRRLFLVGSEKWSLLLYADRPEARFYRLGQADALVREIAANGPATLLIQDMRNFPKLKELTQGIQYDQPNNLGRNLALVGARLATPTTAGGVGAGPSTTAPSP